MAEDTDAISVLTAEVSGLKLEVYALTIEVASLKLEVDVLQTGLRNSRNDDVEQRALVHRALQASEAALKLATDTVTTLRLLFGEAAAAPIVPSEGPYRTAPLSPESE